MHQLILTSQSPRRKKILEEAGYEFCTFPIEVSEILNENLNLSDRISECASQKVKAAIESGKLPESGDFLLLGADTEVVFANKTLGKPKNQQDAINILNQLSGQVHQVITGFCLCDLRSKRLILGHDQTEVRFKRLTSKEIDDYVATGDPMDKAGSYGIQGEAGKFVESINGSLQNVIGLPLKKIEQVITENGWQLKRKLR